MKLRFGKHSGKDILDVPTGYLIWMEENIEWLTDEERRKLNHEIERRSSERSSIGFERKHGRAGFGGKS